MNPASRGATAERPAARVSRVTPEINESLAEFFRLVWGANATAATVGDARAAAAASNPAFPGQEVPEFVFLLNERVIGYLGMVPVSFWNGETETATYWLKGFMVHPDHRNGPVGFNLLKEALKAVGPSGAVAAAPAARRLFTAMGFVECGAIANSASILRHGRFMSRLDIEALGMSRISPPMARAIAMAQRVGIMRAVGAVTGSIQFAWNRGRSLAHLGYRLELDGGLPSAAEVDALWAEARKSLKAAAVRDGRYLAWRYNPGHGKHYEAASVRDRDGRLVGLSIVRRPSTSGDERLRGVKLAVLSDILFAPEHAGACAVALKGAEKIARRMDADAILCSTTSPLLMQRLKANAYLPVPPNVFLLIRDPRGGLGLPRNAVDWWLTRGDDKADDAF